MMKKTLCILLSACLSLVLAVPAVAEGTELNGESKDVTVTVQGIATGEIVYKVDIKWASLTFTYDYKEATSVWNPQTHEYDITTNGTAGWVVDTVGGQKADGDSVVAPITITNHSNAAVKYTATMTDKSSVAGVNVELTGTPTDTLDSAVGKAVGEADQNSFAIEVSNAPENKVAATTAIKQVSIALVKA